MPPQSNSPFANMPGAPGDLYDPARAPGGVYGPAGAQEQGYGTNAEQAGRALQDVGSAAAAVAPVMTFGASTPLQALVGAASGGLGTKSAGGTNLQALRNAAIGAAVPPAAEYGGQVLQKMMGVAPAAEEAAPLVERRSVPSRTTMSATEFTDALKNNRSMRTPFDYTEGARQTANAPGSEAAQRGRAAEIAKKYPVQSINPIRDPFAAPARTAEAPVSHNMITDAEGKPDRLEIMKGDQPLGHLKIEEQIPGTWTVKDATVNQPGKGYGSGAYKQLISEAQKAGIKTIESDISNTSNASGVWKSLQREFPKAVTEENGQYSMDVTRLKK